MDKLERVQRGAIEMIRVLENFTHEDRWGELGLISPEKRPIQKNGVIKRATISCSLDPQGTRQEAMGFN